MSERSSFEHMNYSFGTESDRNFLSYYILILALVAAILFIASAFFCFLTFPASGELRLSPQKACKLFLLLCRRPLHGSPGKIRSQPNLQ